MAIYHLYKPHIEDAFKYNPTFYGANYVAREEPG